MHVFINNFITKIPRFFISILIAVAVLIIFHVSLIAIVVVYVILTKGWILDPFFIKVGIILGVFIPNILINYMGFGAKSMQIEAIEDGDYDYAVAVFDIEAEFVAFDYYGLKYIKWPKRYPYDEYATKLIVRRDEFLLFMENLEDHPMETLKPIVLKLFYYVAQKCKLLVSLFMRLIRRLFKWLFNWLTKVLINTLVSLKNLLKSLMDTLVDLFHFPSNFRKRYYEPVIKTEFCRRLIAEYYDYADKHGVHKRYLVFRNKKK